MIVADILDQLRRFFVIILSIGFILIGKTPSLSKVNLTTQSQPQHVAPNSQQKVIPKDTEPWGVPKKIGEHTYTIKVGDDPRMATAQEILDALNNYRRVNGRGELSFDDRLNSYSHTRAQLFSQIEATDAHAGFEDFLDNQDGFVKLGYRQLGENSYYGGNLYGVHLIEWVFAKSPEHNANQLESNWSHVGIGVSGYGVNLVFGGEKL